MENIEINQEPKTPRRLTRRTSILESQKTPYKTEEGSSFPTTPGRSIRTTDMPTPLRSETNASIQTPRRSCRKSIKPIQEYENIVAQKGLSAKRLLPDPKPNEEVEEDGAVIATKSEERENKWTPADIGRVSTKRSKKKRNKVKRLERQQNIVVEEEVKEDNPEVKECVSSLHEKTEDLDPNEMKKEDQKDENSKLVEMETDGKVASLAEEEIKDVQNLPTDDSMEGGDIILDEMPVTADDCMPSLKNRSLEENKISEPTSPITESSTNFVLESVNKSDDSDCIMLSLSDSCQSRQSTDKKESSICVESKLEANASSESIGTTMSPLVLLTDDEDEALNSDPVIGPFVSQEKINFDVEMCPAQIKKIVVGFQEEPDSKDSPPDLDKEKQLSIPDDPQSALNETFDATVSPPKTPKQSSITRNLTPFKSQNSILRDIIVETDEDVNRQLEFIYNMKEKHLKSSRKRSFSVSECRPKKNVTFHSPSNTTIRIDHEPETPKQKSDNVTKRHRRSLSVTETERDLVDYIRMKKPTQDSTPGKKAGQQQSKIKMPNFFNIHQKQFQRMESITDHVARRAERAKNLINSSSKVKPASVQKGLPPKNFVLRDHNKDTNQSNLPLPKARQKLGLSQGENKPKFESTNSIQTGLKSRSKSKQDFDQFDGLQLLSKTPTKTNVISKQSNNISKLPKHTFNFNFNSKTTAPERVNSTITSVPHRAHSPNPRANFNLSTNITSTTTTTHEPKGDKLEDRRKRMMQMFKSKTSQRTPANKTEILKGVRTNRRFELQMLCRNRQT